MRIDEYVGTSKEWTLPGGFQLNGTYLAWASSQSRVHKHDRPKCRACRWTEFRLFRDKDGGAAPYTIHYTGMSVLTNEVPYYRITHSLGPDEVIERLTTRRPGVAPYLTVAAGRLLSGASAHDAELREAFRMRAVV